MTTVPDFAGKLNAVFLDYDHLQPIVTRDVRVEGMDISVDRETRPAEAASRPGAHVVELSWSRYLRGLTEGSREWVGLPLFPRRCFAHRAWYVRKGAAITSFAELAGARVGTNEWPATGNVWARAAAREAGLELSGVSWVVGSIDGGPAGLGDELPAYAHYEDSGRHLVDLLVEGSLDALVCPVPPQGFYAPESAVVRLLPEVWDAERAYFERVGFYPAHHIVGLRREVFEARPDLASIVFGAFESSRRHWQTVRTRMADTSPWLLEDIERAMRLIGPDWQLGGVEANADMTRALCEELFEQGLVERRIDPHEVFSDVAGLVG